MISVRRLSKKIGQTNILSDISFEIADEAFVIITGRSGSGKSSLLYQLGLLDPIESGQIFIDGDKVTELDLKARTKYRLDNFGFIYQDYGLLNSLTALENTLLPLLMQGVNTNSARAKSMQALKSVNLEEKCDFFPSQLSGGEQQRVGIARAIVQKPKIIFADEPTANLDTESSRKVVNIFKELNKSGQTVIMVTHEKEFISFATQIIVLSDGKVLDNRFNKRIKR